MKPRENDLQRLVDGIILERDSLKKVVGALKLTIFKSPEPWDPGDVELRARALEKVRDHESVYGILPSTF